MSSILVTGGTGSAGSALIRDLLQNSDYRRIICYSRDEYKQHQLQQALGPDPRLRFFLGCVRDTERLRFALRHDVQHVVHCAALKQVPALEQNPIEAIRTNTIGSLNIVQACLDAGVEKALLLSTDKAVAPVNVYGASKAAAERLFLDGNNYAGTKFSVVRYGNVAGSRGSVIPLWREQAKRGHAITLTAATATRFWITIPQAVAFIRHALMTMQGGELLVPRMPSVTMGDVAVLFSDAIAVTGMRPGEKLHEVVIGAHERVEGLPSPYTSDGNIERLTGDDLRAAVGAV